MDRRDFLKIGGKAVLVATSESAGFSLLKYFSSLFLKKQEIEESILAEKQIQKIRKSKYKINSLEKHRIELENIKKSQDALPGEIPKFYNSRELCARYSLKVSEELFGKKFVPHDTWNLRYFNSVVGKIENPREMLDFVKKGILQPGMIIGTKHKTSNYRNNFDILGKKVKYTHSMTYLGLNNNLEPVFAHQWGNDSKRMTLEEVLSKKLTPVEILDSNHL